MWPSYATFLPINRYMMKWYSKNHFTYLKREAKPRYIVLNISQASVYSKTKVSCYRPHPLLYTIPPHLLFFTIISVSNNQSTLCHVLLMSDKYDPICTQESSMSSKWWSIFGFYVTFICYFSCQSIHDEIATSKLEVILSQHFSDIVKI